MTDPLGNWWTSATGPLRIGIAKKKRDKKIQFCSYERCHVRQSLALPSRRIDWAWMARTCCVQVRFLPAFGVVVVSSILFVGIFLLLLVLIVLAPAFFFIFFFAIVVALLEQSVTKSQSLNKAPPYHCHKTTCDFSDSVCWIFLLFSESIIVIKHHLTKKFTRLQFSLWNRLLTWKLKFWVIYDMFFEVSKN